MSAVNGVLREEPMAKYASGSENGRGQMTIKRREKKVQTSHQIRTLQRLPIIDGISPCRCVNRASALSLNVNW